jgi:hypothetical protein
LPRPAGQATNRTAAALLAKQQFVRYLEETPRSPGVSPRVMLKFGFKHMMRGRNFTGVFARGALAPDLAEVAGSRAFTVLFLGWGGHAARRP